MKKGMREEPLHQQPDEEYVQENIDLAENNCLCGMSASTTDHVCGIAYFQSRKLKFMILWVCRKANEEMALFVSSIAALKVYTVNSWM